MKMIVLDGRNTARPLQQRMDTLARCWNGKSGQCHSCGAPYNVIQFPFQLSALVLSIPRDELEVYEYWN